MYINFIVFFIYIISHYLVSYFFNLRETWLIWYISITINYVIAIFSKELCTVITNSNYTIIAIFVTSTNSVNKISNNIRIKTST